MNDHRPFCTDEARWTALKNRNKDAEGFFFYGVTSTYIFCRPGCSSRLPLRKNVIFFVSFQDALDQGFNPCKRCRPVEGKTSAALKLVIESCRRLEQTEKPPPLQELAEHAGLSTSHFHRLFKRIVGITPKQYGVAHQLQRFKHTLLSGSSVTEAIYQSGFSSPSRVYEKMGRQAGIKPKDIKTGGASMTITYGISRCFLGWVIVASSAKGICSIEFSDSPEELPLLLRQRFPRAQLLKGDDDFTSLIDKVVAFIDRSDDDLEVPLDIQGTVFQQKVWNILRQIRPGETKSYSEIAEQLGNPQAVRAVAGACGANRLAVVIPCHRVIGKDGRISGYRWGVDRKKQLLQHESEGSDQD